VMDEAMSTITEAARDTLQRLRAQMQDTVPPAQILSDESATKLQNITAKLNAQVNDRYVFSGDDIFNPPFNNLAALNTSLSGEIAGWLAGPTTAASVAADARTYNGTALGISSTSLTAGRLAVRGDDNTDIDYTVMASQPGFSDVLRGLAVISNLPAPTTPAEQDNYWSVVNGVIDLLDTGTKQIDQYQGILGNKAKLVDDLLAQHSEKQGSFETFIGTIEDVDMADASTRLTYIQTQLQASYSVIAAVKDLSLINFI
jgi:flagellar hook-associated protein 3 FlgL